MRKTLSSKSVLLLAFLLAARPLQAQVPWNQNGPAYLVLVRAAFKGLERVAELFVPLRMITPLADGGGDGGGGDGGGGDGGDGSGSGGGSGGGDGSGSADASGNGDAGDAADGVSADAADVGPGNPDSVSDVAVDPTTNAIPDVPTNDPTMSLRGGVPEGPVPSVGVSGEIVPPSAVPSLPRGAGGAAQDVAIHAVIISGVQSPWNAISKALGVRTVTLTGGLISLGKTTQPGKPEAGGTPPPFLKIIPEPKLLNGSIIPPVVPNVIDARIVGYSVTAEIPVK
jgi:hypothetical protein